jgi:hypothetical protein
MSTPKAFTWTAVLVGMSWVFLGIYQDKHPLPNYARYVEVFSAEFPPASKLVSLDDQQGAKWWSGQRWRFQLSPEDFPVLKEQLVKNRWSNVWAPSGGKFDSFDEESSDGDPLLMTQCSPEGRSVHLFYFYRPSSGVLDAITYPK